MKTAIELAAESIAEGKPAIFPTETVYGLGASVFDEPGILAIFNIKGRPSDNPLIAHVSSIEEAKLLSPELPEPFYRLAEAFWPGPLTIVVERRSSVPAIVSAGLPTIAIRMPSHKIALELIRKTGPLVAPSANLSGRPSPTNLADALEDLGDKVTCFIDGGQCEVGIESTVISLFHEEPTLLRPGRISKEEIEKVLGRKVVEAKKEGPAYSPGMKYRHYAPNARVKLVYEQPSGSYVLPTEENLYANLRQADRDGVKEVTLYCDENVLKNDALMNRINKAATL